MNISKPLTRMISYFQFFSLFQFSFKKTKVNKSAYVNQVCVIIISLLKKKLAGMTTIKELWEAILLYTYP